MNRNRLVFRLRNCVWFLAGWILLAASSARAAEVEMHACHYMPEVKEERKLTPEQEPQVDGRRGIAVKTGRPGNLAFLKIPLPFYSTWLRTICSPMNSIENLFSF